MLFLSIAGIAAADGIDGLLSKAGKESKIVMLELGLVGYIPCDSNPGRRGDRARSE